MSHNLDQIIQAYHLASLFENIQSFIPYMNVTTLPKGTFLYSRPEHQKFVYFLLSGKLQIHATTEDGRQMLVWYNDTFVFLGDMELFGYKDDSNLTEAVTPCTFLTIDTTTIKDELLNDRKFLRFLCDGMAAKIQAVMKEQFRNRANTPHEKIAMHLLQCADATGYFKENLRKTSEILAISYRHLHRVLSDLVAEGILERCNPGYQIMSRQGLENIIHPKCKSVP